MDNINNDDFISRKENNTLSQNKQNDLQGHQENNGFHTDIEQPNEFQPQQKSDQLYSSNMSNTGMGNNGAYSGEKPLQNQSASYNQNKATVKFMPNNMPPFVADSNNGPLSKEEIEYLRKIGEQNYIIKKRVRKHKGQSFEEPRALSRVRRLYSLTFARRYFGYPPLQVKKLRDRAGGDKLGAFGAAAQRVKKMILTMVIIVALIATLGTGVVVTIMAINYNQGITINNDGLIIVNAKEIESVPIDGYYLGQWQDKKLIIKIRNQTNVAVKNVNFRITLSPIIQENAGDDEYSQRKKAFADALANKLIDPTQLVFRYSYDKTKWEMAEGQQVYVNDNVIYGPALKYIGGENGNGIIQSSSDQANDIQVIDNFSIDIQSSVEANKWVNFSMRITFVIEAENVDAKDVDI